MVALTDAAAQAIEVVNEMTIVDGVTVQADTNNRTLNLTIDAGVTAGARLVVKSKTKATETTLCGTGMTGPGLVGVAGKTKVVEFVYDGAKFIQAGAGVQLD